MMVLLHYHTLSFVVPVPVWAEELVVLTSCIDKHLIPFHLLCCGLCDCWDGDVVIPKNLA